MAYNSKYTGAQVEALLDRAGAAPQTYDIGWLLDIIYGNDAGSGTPSAVTKEQWDEVVAAKAAGKMFVGSGILWVPYVDDSYSKSDTGDTIDYIALISTIIDVQWTSNPVPGDYPLLREIAVMRRTTTSGSITYNAGQFATYSLVEKYMLDNYAKTTDLPTKTSQLTNDSGFITADDVTIPGKTVVKTVESNIGYGNGYTLTTPSIELAADKFHIVGKCQGLTLTLPDGADMDGQEYCCQFYVGTSSFTLTLPASVYWQNGEAPKFASNTCCQLVIVNNCATIGVFKAS